MAAFDLALASIQSGSHDLLSPKRIDQLARDLKHEFRQTLLTPGKTVSLFVQQVAYGNVACTAVPHLAGEDFTDTAWCQARQRLPIEVIQSVHRSIVDEARRELDSSDDLVEQGYLWRGHRVRLVDGSNDSMPDTPVLREHYGVSKSSKPGLGFPNSHLMFLMDHRTGLLLDCIDSKMQTHDAAVVSQTHQHLQSGDVVLGDDAFSSYVHIALLLQARAHAIMPAHHKRLVDFRPGRDHVTPGRANAKNARGKTRSKQLKLLGKDDQLVEYAKPAKRPDWMTQQQWATIADTIVVREIRRTVRRHGFRPIVVTIATTLLDPQAYPADELIELRLTRWLIETNIRHLKITLGMDVLKCKTVDGIRKERLIFLIVYNLIRVVMLHAAKRQRVNPNRVSFADALAWLRYGDLNAKPKLVINPHRPGRLEPRVLKRTTKQFPYMTQPRATLKTQLRATHCVTG